MADATRNVVADSQLVLERHAKSFRWAQLFLGPGERADSALAYAFCRSVDDAVDDAPSAEVARTRLVQLRAMLEDEEEPTTLVHAYRALALRRDFGLGPARALLLGAESDLGEVRMKNDADLGTYCYRVAGTVGLMMCGILGVSDARAKRHAVDLGVAMQLTNICRDVREDANLGRVYLPASRLGAHGLGARDLLEGGVLDTDSDKRASLCAVTNELLELADTAYLSGEAGLRYLPPRARLAIAVASRVYGGIGRRLRRVQGSDPWLGRVQVPAHEKLRLLCGALGPWARATIGSPRAASGTASSALPLPTLES